MIELTLNMVEDLAIGTAILGSGGGGEPYVFKLAAKRSIQENGPVQVLDLLEIPDDYLIFTSAAIGSGIVLSEKLIHGGEATLAVKELEKILGKKCDALVSIEIGGVNGVTPLIPAAQLHLPLVDGDMMGRAFPELQMSVPSLYNINPSPIIILDSIGNQTIIRTADTRLAENLARSVTMQLGGFCMLALFPMTGNQIKNAVIPGSISRALKIGQKVQEARLHGGEIHRRLVDATSGIFLFRGKVKEIHRQITGGGSRGEILLEGVGEQALQTMTVHFQNEFILATLNRKIVASVPDTIVLMDTHTTIPVTVESARSGLDVVVIGLPSAPCWQTPAGLALVGPRIFGYESDYHPLLEQKQGSTINMLGKSGMGRRGSKI